MRLLIALACLLPAVHAQPLAPSETGAPERVRGARRVFVATAGIVGGTAAGVATGLALASYADDPLGTTLIAVAIPVGATLLMQTAGRAVGAEAPVLANARDVALGVGVGSLVMVAGVGLGLLVEVVLVGAGEIIIFGPLAGGFVGGLVGTGLLVKLSTRSFRLAPTALAAPTGERAAGLSVRVGL